MGQYLSEGNRAESMVRWETSNLRGYMCLENNTFFNLINAKGDDALPYCMVWFVLVC